MRNMDEYFADPSARRRPRRTETDKSFVSIGVDFAELYSRASAESEIFAAQLALSFWFGMRPKESWLWRSHENVDDETRRGLTGIARTLCAARSTTPIHVKSFPTVAALRRLHDESEHDRSTRPS